MATSIPPSNVSASVSEDLVDKTYPSRQRQLDHVWSAQTSYFALHNPFGAKLRRLTREHGGLTGLLCQNACCMACTPESIHKMHFGLETTVVHAGAARTDSEKISQNYV